MRVVEVSELKSGGETQAAVEGLEKHVLSRGKQSP